ncbi:MAG: co-chaperone GroES [Candidatus Rhabdochlamydia sp.]
MTDQTKKKLSIHPTADRVLGQRLEQEETLRGGIILPDSAKKKQESIKVVAVGPGEMTKEGKTLPMPFAVGDVILVNKYAGQEVSIDNDEFVIVKADDIIAIVK